MDGDSGNCVSTYHTHAPAIHQRYPVPRVEYLRMRDSIGALVQHPHWRYGVHAQLYHDFGLPPP